MLKSYLSVLEKIEKCVVNSNAKDKAAKESTEKASGKGKQICTNPNEFQIPQKAKVEKSCMMCQKHGGMHTTHNTGECHKNKKDGTPKQGFSKKQRWTEAP